VSFPDCHTFGKVWIALVLSPVVVGVGKLVVVTWVMLLVDRWRDCTGGNSSFWLNS
jgi:hypothetical protein